LWCSSRTLLHGSSLLFTPCKKANRDYSATFPESPSTQQIDDKWNYVHLIPRFGSKQGSK
jgi:hypothetical protein